MWGQILQVADGNPLLAMQIEEQVSAVWWHRTVAYRNAVSKLNKK